MLKNFLNPKTRPQLIQEAINNAIRNIHSEEFKFTLEEQTDIVEGIQKKQFDILEAKLSELEEIVLIIEDVRKQIDRITIIEVND